MLSISKPLDAAKADEYYERDNYYLESQGYWYGGLADSLHLEGEIKENEFKNMLRGFNADGAPLIADAGKTYKDGTLVHRAGIDLTFSAPKSVSILSYYDERIQAAFNRALQTTLDYAEERFTQARHKKKGTQQIAYENTKNAAFAVFNHRTSRELDPQLHAHCVMMNLTQSGTGKIMCSHNDKFFENKMHLGLHFRNELGIEMQKLGFQINITDRLQGFWEIKGASDEIITDFSTRREQVKAEMERLRQLTFKDLSPEKIEEWATERLALVRHREDYPRLLREKIDALSQSAAKVYDGWGDAELANLATTNSRFAKRNVTKEFVVDRINAVLGERGENLEDLAQTALNQEEQRQQKLESTKAVILAEIETLTKTEAAFTRENLMTGCMKIALGQYTQDQLDETFENMLKSGELVHLRDCLIPSKGVKAIYTTAEMKNIENESIEICRTSKTNIRVDEAAADAFINNENDKLYINSVLSTEQAKFIEHIGELEPEQAKAVATLRKQYQKDKNKLPSPQEIFEANPELKDFFNKHGQGFTPGQVEALRLMVATDYQFPVIQGDAGTGKSFSMMYAKNLLQSQGFHVRGLAPTGKATDGLAEAAKLDKSLTIHKFVLLWGASEKFRKSFKQDKEFFVIDEAGMLGAKITNEFLKIAKEIGAKVAFVGDRKQFAAVEAGQFFIDLQDKAFRDVPKKDKPIAIMQDVIRQKTNQTKNIVKAISEKKFDVAFNHLMGYSIIEIQGKSRGKNYKIGQKLLFNCESQDKEIPAGTNAEIINTSKTRLTIKYNRNGKDVIDTINPATDYRKFTVFAPNDHTNNGYDNCIHQIKNEDACLQAVADDYLAQYKEKKDALVITGTNADRQKLNAIIRQSLIEQNLISNVGEYTLHEPKSVSKAGLAGSYEIGQIINIGKTLNGTISAVDQHTNTITVLDNENNEHVINCIDLAKKPPNLFSVTTTALGVNEKIAFLKNAKIKDIKGNEIDVRNGQLATIKSIDKDGNVVASIGESKPVEVKFNINEDYNYFTAAYALSAHKSQGMTVNKLIWHANTDNAISMNSGYVAATRCKHEIAIYTNDVDKLQEKMQIEQEKYSTVGDEEIIQFNIDDFMESIEKPVFAEQEKLERKTQKINLDYDEEPSRTTTTNPNLKIDFDEDLDKDIVPIITSEPKIEPKQEREFQF